MVEPGNVVAGHRVERLLGDNSLSGTWLVTASDGSPAILRVMMLFTAAYQERYRRSAELLLRANHPHLVRVLQVVDVDGFAGSLEEHVSGGTLGEWIARGPHPADAIVGMLHGILSGVAAAHELGLLHRNLKPSMVLLDDAGQPKVDDFALGKVTVAGPDEQALTQLGTTFGTPQYMAPEQYKGAALVDAQADLFSIGCIAYEMCTGRRAFDGDDPKQLYGAISRGEYAPIGTVRSDLPPALVALVDALMRPDPAERPESARAALGRLIDDPELDALLPTTRTRRTGVTGVPAEYATPAPIPARPEGVPSAIPREPVRGSPPIDARPSAAPPAIALWGAAAVGVVLALAGLAYAFGVRP